MYWWIILQFTCFTLVICGNIFPHYGQSPISDTNQNFRKNREKLIGKVPAKVLSNNNVTIDDVPHNQITNNVTIDDVPHFEINRKNTQLKKINEIEAEFRTVIGMRGLKYTFKRDQFWRTWRKVSFSGKDRIVCYKCENSVNFTNCHNGGYWIIEDKPPPCPYELFSFSKEDKICAIHINKYYNVKNKCSEEINVGDLSGDCDNPIATELRIMKVYNSKVSERFPSVICGGRESCRILTLYNIAADNISFRIVNSENNVIYSRVMKEGKNYACIKNCGTMDPDTRIITKSEITEKPVLLSHKKRKTKKHIILRY